jgi:hypothetical protein
MEIENTGKKQKTAAAHSKNVATFVFGRLDDVAPHRLRPLACLLLGLLLGVEGVVVVRRRGDGCGLIGRVNC